KGGPVDLKVMFRLHINPKSIAVMTDAEMERIKDMSGDIPSETGLKAMGDDQVASLIQDKILPIRSMLLETRSRYQDVEDDLSVLARFVDDTRVGNTIDAKVRERVNTILLHQIGGLFKSLTSNKKTIESGLQYFDGFIAVSDQTRQLWQNSFPSLDVNKVEVVPNEIMYAVYQTSPEVKRQKRGEFLSSLGIKNPEEKTVISYVGRFEEQKGYWVLEEMMGKL
ncbi:MAG TPA: hypothetical protein VJH22_06080, partial [Candidatus Nanoarchaeia archaeon]|nr:hypothetical protein [Candidatus Nanoarchaeia archaeon]